MKNYGYSKVVDASFEEVVDKLSSSLGEQGFGILTTIDMRKKLKDTLDKEIEEYMIFGACNPKLAYEALEGEYEIGLLLPCNVIVYKKDGKITVSAIVPTTAMNMLDNEKVKHVAMKAEKLLKTAIDNV